jgi:hypothetical protein
MDRFAAYDAATHGNGAREAIRRYLAANYEPQRLTREDHLLAWLWKEGFWVAPLDPPADFEESESYKMGMAFERAKAAMSRAFGKSVHQAIMERALDLMDAEKDTAEGRELDLLGQLAQFYEREEIGP